MTGIVEYAVYEKLKTLAGGKVYAMRAPDNITNDFIIFQRTGGERWRDFNAPSDKSQVTMQIDVYGKTYYNVKQIAQDVETILDGFRGSVAYGNNSPQDTIFICGITLQDEADLYDQEEEPFIYRSNMTFLITFDKG